MKPDQKAIFDLARRSDVGWVGQEVHLVVERAVLSAAGSAVDLAVGREVHSAVRSVVDSVVRSEVWQRVDLEAVVLAVKGSK